MPKNPKTGRFPARLAELSNKNIAAYFGVSARTIQRWKKSGVPKERQKALKALKVEKPSKRVLAALKLPAQALALAAGVTIATARKWRRQGGIPKRSRAFLTAQKTGKNETPITRFKTRFSRANYEGRITNGQIMRWDFPESGQELDGREIQKMLKKLANAKNRKTKGMTFQAVFECVSELASSEHINQSYQTIEAKNGKKTPIVICSTANATISELLAECQKLLVEAAQYLTVCQSFRLIARVPK